MTKRKCHAKRPFVRDDDRRALLTRTSTSIPSSPALAVVTAILSTWPGGPDVIRVVGSGDFTHPGWREELGAKLVPDAPGAVPVAAGACSGRCMTRCRPRAGRRSGSCCRRIFDHLQARRPDEEGAPPAVRAVARGGRRDNQAAAAIGNLASDGRPILGLDSRDLLELTLSGGDGCYLVPAHAWTPWFAVLGSQSGFDRVADCYADLAPHIFAIETGLSSDPEMNWRVSSLDGYRLVSNSDAHSPPMLGREATAFTCDADYFSIYQALRTGDGFDGTVEFFPEEGKYHLDGHRACDVRTTPSQTRAAGGKCPVCGKTPTIGVQHRVDLLADRPEGYRVPGAAGFTSFVQLPEILGEIAGMVPSPSPSLPRSPRWWSGSAPSCPSSARCRWPTWPLVRRVDRGRGDRPAPSRRRAPRSRLRRRLRDDRYTCCDTERILPSGSLNQATLSPVGAVQIPSLSCSKNPNRSR